MDKRVLLFSLGALAVASEGCVPWRRHDHVTMVGSLESSELRTNDVLRIRRQIRNGGSRPVYLSWGPGMPSFSARDSLGRRACYTDGPFILVAALATINPGDSTAHDAQWPLRGLSNCGPGRYTVDASVAYGRSMSRDGGGGTLPLRGLSLVIRDSTSR